jgi:uncharacterized protein (TIGR03437 family)
LKQRSFAMIRLLALGSLLLVCLLAQPQVRSAAQTDTLVNVCAANYSRNFIAFDSIVAAFGAQLAAATVVAGDTDPQMPGIQLPTVLGGVSVRVAGKLAPLFFVSPGQINYLVPPGLRVEDLNNNFAMVEVVNGGNVVASGRALINRVAPAFFTFDSSGGGLPAALIVRVKPDDSQIIEALGETTGTPRGMRVRLVDVSPADERVFLVLYLSGVRNATDANQDENVNENIRVLLNGYEVDLYYAGAQRELAGLDQINVQIPRAFYGEAKLRLTVQWKERTGAEVSTEVPLATPPVESVSWTGRGLNQRVINSLAASEAVLLAGTDAGIFRSLDAGASWQESAGNAATFNTLALAHARGSEFYAGGAGLLHSADNGATWASNLLYQADQILFSGRTISALHQSLYLFAGTERGLLRKDGFPGGLGPNRFEWGSVSEPVPIKALTSNFARVYAGTDGQGVLSGAFGTAPLTASNQGLPANAKVSALTASAHFIFAAVAESGLYRSTDNGATWERVTNGLPSNGPFTALASYGRNIFAGMQGGGVYLSTDFGLSWNAANSGLSNLDVRSLLVAKGRLYVGTSAGVFAADNIIPPSRLAHATLPTRQHNGRHAQSHLAEQR